MINRKLTPEGMMAKAEEACSEARLLLQHGHMNGAANRAYYAMFDAARAALLASGAPVDLDTIRTHSGLKNAFGNFLVKNGPVPKDIGRLLGEGYDVRFKADYTDDFIDPDVAKEIVEEAEKFVATIRTTLI